MWLCLHHLLLSAALAVPAAHAAAHYTGYDHGPGVPSATVGLDIVLGVEEAKPIDNGADYHEYLNSLSHRPMVPHQWYPYEPSGRPGGGGYYKPSRWPEGHGAQGAAGQGRPGGDHKPTVLYLEGDQVPGVEGRPNRPELLPDPQERPDRPDPHRPDHFNHPDRPSRPDRPDRPERPQRPLNPPVGAFICPDQHSCSDSVWDRRDTRSSLSWSDRGCFCDAECRRYGDCCLDAPALEGDQEGEEGEDQEDNEGRKDEKGDTQLKLRVVGEDGDQQRLKDNREEQEKFECRAVPVFSSLGSTSEEKEGKWYMVTACPRQFDGYDNKVRCEVPGSASEDPLSALPVTSTATNTTYSSLFCAMCHNDTDDLAFWQLGLRCPDITAHGPTEGELLDRLRRTSTGWGLALDSGRVHHCELIARPPAAVRPRPCRALYDRCPLSSPLRDACKNHTAAVFFAGRVFRNVYCALCSGGRPGQVRCNAPCSATERPADIGGLRMRLGITPGNDDRCGETEIRDPFSRRCRSTVCSRPGYSLVDGTCVRNEQDEPEDSEEDQDGRDDRGEEGEGAELTHPDDNLLPMQGLVDTENAIEVELIDALGPAAVDGSEEGEEAPGAEQPEPQQLNAIESEAEAELEAAEAAAAAAVEEEGEEEGEGDQEEELEGSGVVAEEVVADE